eukprot:TRINITY_DN14121_c0_g1_i2.p1 TRINITY_DN14121_c0_g1~~TRINITY_DN14121_c0_g1_i2.p1  ORF type:complete len:322 (-),score=59.69 TRINITY_DN14121_c0_g1_i2:46-1011(-)
MELLGERMRESVYQLPEQKKRKMAKIFRSSKEFKNYLSYGFLSGPGKETFRIRGVNQKAKESILVPDLLYPDELFDAGYDLMEELHHFSLQSLRILSDNIPSVDPEYIFSHCELDLLNPEQSNEPELSFSLSHMNMLRYYDPSKPIPVNQHTDQYLLTVIPLNSSNPSLEVWDFKDKEWIPIERNIKSQYPDAPCYSIGVVLVGETLSWITNDYFVSSLHRVVAPNKTARFSCPFFLSAQKNKILDPSRYMGQGKIFGTIKSNQNPNNDQNMTKMDQTDTVTPIELGNFLWECTQKPNETHETIQNRYNQSIVNRNNFSIH